jgi:hypothetical protein
VSPKYPKLYKIRFLEDTCGNSKGEEVWVRGETDKEIDYRDGFKRWCYLYKAEEGTVYERVTEEGK